PTVIPALSYTTLFRSNCRGGGRGDHRGRPVDRVTLAEISVNSLALHARMRQTETTRSRACNETRGTSEMSALEDIKKYVSNVNEDRKSTRLNSSHVKI